MRGNGSYRWLWLTALLLLAVVAGVGLRLRSQPSPMAATLATADAGLAHTLAYGDGHMYVGTQIGLFTGPSARFLRQAKAAQGRVVTAVVPTAQGVYLGGPELGVSVLQGDTLTPLLTGHVTALVAGPDGRLVAAVAERGLIASGEGGTSWQNLTDPGLAVSALAIDPGDANRILAGGVREGQGTIALSLDGGQTWQRTDDLDAVLSLAFDPKNPGQAYAAAGGVIWSSNDGGSTWMRRVQVPGHEVVSVAFDNRRKPVLVVLTPNGQIVEPLLY